MKNYFITSLAVLTLATTVSAETTIVMTGVHNCCGGCEKGITKAASKVEDATIAIDDETVTITAKKESDAKKAVEAIRAGGYYGSIEGEEAPTASTKVLKGATVENVHLCCKKCVTAVEKALKDVKGVTGSSIESKADSFTVEGEFSEGDLIAAMNAAGFHGSVK